MEKIAFFRIIQVLIDSSQLQILIDRHRAQCGRQRRHERFLAISKCESRRADALCIERLMRWELFEANLPVQNGIDPEWQRRFVFVPEQTYFID